MTFIASAIEHNKPINLRTQCRPSIFHDDTKRKIFEVAHHPSPGTEWGTPMGTGMLLSYHHTLITLITSTSAAVCLMPTILSLPTLLYINDNCYSLRSVNLLDWCWPPFLLPTWQEAVCCPDRANVGAYRCHHRAEKWSPTLHVTRTCA